MAMSFRTKMITGIALIEGLFLFAILMSSLGVLSQSRKQALVTRATGDVRLFATAAANALVSDDIGALQRIMRQVMHNHGIAYAAAWDGNGRLLARAGHKAVSAHTYRAAASVMVDGTSYGRVEIEATDHGFAPILARASRRIVAIALGEMLLVGLVSWLFGAYLMRQIAAIEAGTARIARGEFGFRLPVVGRDELARMIEGFNAMSAQLKALQDETTRQHQQVLAVNERLEERVHERTEALAVANRELEYLAMHDPLTGLPNRILLQDRLLQAIRIGHRETAPFALMVLDLDGFKEVNDSLGHYAGDRLLQEVATRLVARLRQSDTAVRLGGDEFAILLPNVVNAADTETVARKLLRGLEEPVVLGDRRICVTASCGAALFPVHGDEVGVLLRHADRAMYEAKRGRRGFLLFAPAMDEEGDDRLRLQVDLDHAIRHGDLVLHYQPKVDLATGKVSGAEALVRWQHPVLGMLPPARFVPLAERTHLIGPLTFHVLRLAATQARAWVEQGRPLPIAVNVSAINLDDGGFVDSVERILKGVGVAAGLIELEVTETALMRDPERAQAAIQALSKLGVHVAIDDFGTGYSSMTYLRKLAVAKIKIDKSFVMDMGVSRNDSVIVRSIIDLGHSLGLKVVGEGVETADTMAVLASLGCDYAQGFHLARPMDAEAFDAWRQENM